jgi:hypothetical protein
MPGKHIYAQSYLDSANTLMTVSVFAGAISFGTLVTLPLGLPNAQYISKLLAIASYLFTCCLFAAIGIAYMLRFDERHRPLSPTKRMLCQMHVWLVIFLLVAGFVVINVVMMNFGQKSVGIVGIASLAGVIPIWFVGLGYLEKTGLLDHKTSTTTAENPSGLGLFPDGRIV